MREGVQKKKIMGDQLPPLYRHGSGAAAAPVAALLEPRIFHTTGGGYSRRSSSLRRTPLSL